MTVSTHKEKRPAPVARRARSIGHSIGPVRHAQRAEVGNILRSTGAQAKLTIGQPNDKYEQEADRVADQVVRMSDADVAQCVESGRIQPIQIQRMCAECEDELAQRQLEEEEEQLQAKEVSGQTPQVSSDIESRINSLNGGGQPLDPATRSFFEPRFGHDFSGVRIHHDGQAADISRSINSRAFTLGNNVVFGSGEYQPQSNLGRQLLGHELTHVLQQSGSGVADVSSVNLKQGSQIQCKRGAAGGCGICLGGQSGTAAGKIAHREIQLAFWALYNQMGWEVPVQVVPGDETSPFMPSLDLAYEEDGAFGRTIYIGEIKPLDDAGRQQELAEQQLREYASQLHFTHDEVFRMTLMPPPVLPFINPMHPPGCPQQVINVVQTAPGVYQYFCEPPWSELVSNPSCTCRENPPDPLPGGQPQEQDEYERRRLPEPTNIERIAEWARSVYEEGLDARDDARRFLQRNPDLVNFIILIGVIVLIVLILDDLSGVGTADDWLIPIVAELEWVAITL